LAVRIDADQRGAQRVQSVKAGAVELDVSLARQGPPMNHSDLDILIDPTSDTTQELKSNR
jgi:hypothetical protein